MSWCCKKNLGTLYQDFKKVFAELRFYVTHVSMKCSFCYDKLSNLSHTHCLFFILYNFYEFKGLCFKTRISKACVLNSHIQHTLVFEQRRASYLLLTPATLHKLNIPFNQVIYVFFSNKYCIMRTYNINFFSYKYVLAYF